MGKEYQALCSVPYITGFKKLFRQLNTYYAEPCGNTHLLHI